MALKKCKECGNEVSTKAKKCPNCGAPIKSGSCLIGMINMFVIGLAVVFLINVFGGESDSTEASGTKADIPWQDREYKLNAYSMCEDWVKERLKSPSTADFPGIFDGKKDHVVQTRQRYKVSSYVDSQNSFGGTVRTNFTCITEQTSKGKWTLKTLELD